MAPGLWGGNPKGATGKREAWATLRVEKVAFAGGNRQSQGTTRRIFCEICSRANATSPAQGRGGRCASTRGRALCRFCYRSPLWQERPLLFRGHLHTYPTKKCGPFLLFFKIDLHINLYLKIYIKRNNYK